MLRLLLITATLMTGIVHGQRVLHFTETSGFDHNTRGVSFQMFSSIADELMLEVVDAPDPEPFSDFIALSDYDVIVFSNTSGDQLLDGEQRANFEQWVANGGHVLGIHAASDTYRHSSANGNNTGSWDFYPELIGASVQEGPNHVAGTPEYSMSHIGEHPSTDALPDPWTKNEEYYYWEGGYYGPDNNPVLEVEATIGPNGQVNSYDAARPMSWYRQLPSGSRVFYTALGHAQSNYTDDLLFRAHLRDALLWLLDGSTSVGSAQNSRTILCNPNPTNGRVKFFRPSGPMEQKVVISNMTGVVVFEGRLGPESVYDAEDLPSGAYTVRILDAHHGFSIGRFIRQ